MRSRPGKDELVNNRTEFDWSRISAHLDDAGLSPRAFRVWCHLLRRSDNESYSCFPSQRSIGKVCDLSPHTVAATLAELKRLEFITIEEHNGGCASYSVTPGLLKLGRKNLSKNWITLSKFPPTPVQILDSHAPARVESLEGNPNKATVDFDHKKLQQSWEDFQQHRKELGKSITPLARKRLLKVIRNMKTADAIEAVEQSIANGWTGIFPPKGGKNGAGAQARYGVVETGMEEQEMEERETK